MSDAVKMSEKIFQPVNTACKGFIFETKKMAGALNDQLVPGFNPDELTKQLGDQFEAFLGMDKDAYNWKSPQIVASHDCKQVDLEFPSVDQTVSAGQRTLKFNANRECKGENPLLNDACFALTKPDGSSLFCSLRLGCKKADAIPNNPSFVTELSEKEIKTTTSTANAADSTTTAPDQTTMASGAPTVDSTTTAPDQTTMAGGAPTADSTTPAPDQTTTASGAPTADSTTTSSSTPQTPSSSNPSNSGNPTSSTDVWGMTKVGAGSIATLLFGYKAVKEAHKWYNGSNETQKLDLPSLSEGRMIESMADASQKTNTPPNSGWRAIAYSTAAAASLAFTVYSL